MNSEFREGWRMDLIGEIVREPDPPGLDKRQWIDLIQKHPQLVALEPREAINPFTKKITIVPPRTDVARVLQDGDEIGLMSWAEDDSNLINVFGEAQAMIPLVIEVAGILGGRFSPAIADEER